MKPIATKEPPRKKPPPQASAPRRRDVKSGAEPPLEVGVAPPGPAHEALIREAAYFIYERSGRIDGRELENWLQAEAELMQSAGAAPSPGGPLPG